VSFEELGAMAAERGRGISAGAILADGCRTGTGAWQRAVRDCLQGEVTYIGTSANIGWHDSTVFCSAFYGALFRGRGRRWQRPRLPRPLGPSSPSVAEPNSQNGTPDQALVHTDSAR
jgi:hypothetical protein